MFFPRLPRTFTRKFHKAENKRERTIQGSFLIAVPSGSKITEIYPKRVSLGEVLIDSGALRILAPVNGVATLTEDGTHFQIKQDGVWKTSSPFQNRNYSFAEVLEKFVEGALASLDFPNLSLLKLFSSFSPENHFKIVISPFTRYNHLSFDEMIVAEMKEPLDQFLLLLKSTFPKAEILSHIDSGKIPYSHPLGIPEFFIHKITGEDIPSVNEQIQNNRILFLGPETIYHILRSLYYDEPFTRRHLSVCLVDRKGRMDTESRQFLLTNGQSLDFIRQNNDKRYKVASFQSMFDSVNALDINSLGNFNIYEHYLLLLYERLPVVRNEFACIDCNECNTYCPTNANPFALVKKRFEDFEKESCIECGICTVYCPSGIDIRSRILEVKGL
ncbi:oxidoreductase [Leptospira kobayashii]|uniref:Oxidoreductase n=1 Tax=Leptospira kobayashii TaxID=1917830 RepID=A0ABM7UGE0_9LEPT|nr:4Fe-4S dicluster domain-containing protein [Leptospira kobayashii]BDA77677.1 oxidoreductase [Leptospira kobayashii]